MAKDHHRVDIKRLAERVFDRLRLDSSNVVRDMQRRGVHEEALFLPLVKAAVEKELQCCSRSDFIGICTYWFATKFLKEQTDRWLSAAANKIVYIAVITRLCAQSQNRGGTVLKYEPMVAFETKSEKVALENNARAPAVLVDMTYIAPVFFERFSIGTLRQDPLDLSVVRLEMRIEEFAVEVSSVDNNPAQDDFYRNLTPAEVEALRVLVDVDFGENPFADQPPVAEAALGENEFIDANLEESPDGELDDVSDDPSDTELDELFDVLNGDGLYRE